MIETIAEYRYALSKGQRIRRTKRKIVMKKNYILKPFDLERAKNGEPVCTIDGHDARIVCWDWKLDDTDKIIALVTLNNGLERLEAYEPNGDVYKADRPWHDLMMKVEEPTIFAKVDGEIIPFGDAKRKLGENIIILNSLIIKTYDGKFLEIWKGAFGYYDWKKAQETASEIGDGWRCPTRRECLDIFDAIADGLNETMEEIGGDLFKDKTLWTCEKFQPNPNYAVAFSGFSGSLNMVSHFQERWVRPVKLIEPKEE